MSKERLDEIEEINRWAHIHHDELNEKLSKQMIERLFNGGYIDWIIKYAREQAERAQESEKELTYYKMATESYEDMESQNERYREIIQDFIDHAEDYNIAKVEKYHLRKALEESQ